MQRVFILIIILAATPSCILAQCVATPGIHATVNALDASGKVSTAVGVRSTFVHSDRLDTLVFWRSVDHGYTWMPIETRISIHPEGPYEVPVYLQQLDTKTSFTVGWDQLDAGRIVSSYDAGLTWSVDSSIKSRLLDVSCSPSGEGMILGEAPPLVALHGDDGWHVVSFAPMLGTPKGWALGRTLGNGEYRVFCTKGTHLTADRLEAVYWTSDSWKTTDSSLVPLSFSDSLPDYDADCLFGKHGVVIVSAYTFSVKGAGQVVVCRSTDGGQSWSTSRFDGTRSPSPIRFITRAESDTILAHDASSRNLLDYSIDGGLTWKVDTVILSTGESGAVSVSVAAPLEDGAFAAAFNTSTAPYSFLGRLQLPSVSAVNPRRKEERGLTMTSQSASAIRFEGAIGDVRVSDILGRMLLEGRIDGVVDVSRFAPGLYLIADASGRSVRFIIP